MQNDDISIPESETNIKQPFDVILAAIFEADEVKIASLFRLSDMAQQAYDKFMVAWVQASADRRALIARHMADISEQNFEVEFAPVFKQFLTDPNEAVRLAALDGLWDTTNKAVIPAIIKLLQGDKSAEVRRAAAATLAHVILLGEWGQIPAYFRDKAAAALIVAHKNDDQLAVRCAALESLGASSDEQVPTLIAEAYESDHPEMLLSALFAMGNSADEVWGETLSAEMENPDAKIRSEAARAAGELGSGNAVADLADLVFDPDEEVQTAAILALGKIATDQALELLQQFGEDAEISELHPVIQRALVNEDDPFTEQFFDDDFDDDWDEDETWENNN